MANGYKKFGVYVFRDQDPMIQVLDTVRRSGKVKDSEIRKRCDDNISTSTLRNWWSGKTRRPMLATIANAALALNMESIPLTAEGRKKVIAKYK